METEPIQDYILNSEQNLNIAAAVHAAWEAARKKIITGFLERLDARLKQELTGWKSEPYRDFFVDSQASYTWWKPAWVDEYWLCLATREHGEEMVFGVLRDGGKIGKRPFCDELLTSIRKIHSSARTHNVWWEARVKMDSPARDWRKPEVLWRLHKDEKFLEEVAQQLLEVAKVSEPIIDEWLARKKWAEKK